MSELRRGGSDEEQESRSGFHARAERRHRRGRALPLRSFGAVDRAEGHVLPQERPVLFRAHWANDTRAVASALEAVAAGQVPRPSQSSGVVKATLRMLRNIAPVLDRAGQGAWADMWWVAPPAAVAAALKLLGVRPRRPRRPDRSRQKQAPAAAVGDQKDLTSDEVINEPASWKAFWASTTAGISDEQRAARWPLQQLRAGRARECGERENSTAVPEQ
jgi:hypothetical protein